MLEILMIAGALALWCVSGFVVIRRLVCGPSGRKRWLKTSHRPGSASDDWQVWLKSGGDGADYDRRNGRR